MIQLQAEHPRQKALQEWHVSIEAHKANTAKMDYKSLIGLKIVFYLR